MRKIHYQKSGIKWRRKSWRLGWNWIWGRRLNIVLVGGRLQRRKDNLIIIKISISIIKISISIINVWVYIWWRGCTQRNCLVVSFADPMAEQVRLRVLKRSWRPPNNVIPAPLPLVALVLSPPHPGYGLRGDLIFRVGHPWVGARELQVALRMICKDTNAILWTGGQFLPLYRSFDWH